MPTIFERKMLRRIGRWRTRKVGVLEQAMAAANRRIREGGGIARRIPGFEWSVDNVAVGLLRTTNEFAQESVWQEAILEEYCRAGHEVRGVEDVRALDLEIVHTAVRGLTVKYGSVTAAHGAAAGLAGFAGIVPDVIGLVAFNLRAAGEFATYCGYNIRESPERLFAVQILYHVSDPAPRSLEPALVSAETISRDIASRACGADHKAVRRYGIHARDFAGAWPSLGQSQASPGPAGRRFTGGWWLQCAVHEARLRGRVFSVFGGGACWKSIRLMPSSRTMG